MLFELRYYAPSDYNIRHYGLVEADTVEHACDKLKAAKAPLQLGGEPISLRKVVDPNTHDWGMGFDKKCGDLDRRVA